MVAAARGSDVRLVFRVGESDADYLGYGWGEAVRQSELSTMRWMNKLESDLFFTMAKPRSMTLFMKARPRYINWRNQQVGIWMNGRFVTEWTCYDDSAYHIYTAEIPANYFTAGKNRLIIRCGYLYSAEKGDGEHSLGIEEISLVGDPDD